MNSDAVYTELLTRRAGATAEDHYKRVCLFLDAMDAHRCGHLAHVLEALRQRGETAGVFRHMDTILRVQPRWWCWCGVGGIYADFSDDDLMAALSTAILKF